MPEAGFQGYIDPNWPPTGAEGDSSFIIYGLACLFVALTMSLDFTLSMDRTID